MITADTVAGGNGVREKYPSACKHWAFVLPNVAAVATVRANFDSCPHKNYMRYCISKDEIQARVFVSFTKKVRLLVRCAVI